MSRAWFFVMCVLLVVLWAPSYFLLGELNTWQLIINTITTIVTFLLVALLQNTQKRADEAVQHKLNAIADALSDLMGQFPRTTRSYAPIVWNCEPRLDWKSGRLRLIGRGADDTGSWIITESPVRENAVNGQSSGVNQPSRTARVVGSVRQAVSASSSASITARVVNGGAGGQTGSRRSPAPARRRQRVRDRAAERGGDR